MIPDINSMYEITFLLVHNIGIQPSEVNKLSVPESMYFLKYYNDIKIKEKELMEKEAGTKVNN